MKPFTQVPGSQSPATRLLTAVAILGIILFLVPARVRGSQGSEVLPSPVDPLTGAVIPVERTEFDPAVEEHRADVDFDGVALGDIVQWLREVPAYHEVNFVVSPRLADYGGLRAKELAQTANCVNNLRQIDGAKHQWAIENRRTEEAVPEVADIEHFLRDPETFVCPAGGTYSLNAVGVRPTCTTPGHVMGNQVLVDHRVASLLPNERIRAASLGRNERITVKLRSAGLRDILNAIGIATDNRVMFEVRTPTLVALVPGADMDAAVPTESTRALPPPIYQVINLREQLRLNDPGELDETIRTVRELVSQTLDSIHGNTDLAPKLQFHPGSGILVIVGQPEAIKVAMDILRNLSIPREN